MPKTNVNIQVKHHDCKPDNINCWCDTEMQPSEMIPHDILQLPEEEQFLYVAMQEYYVHRNFKARNVKAYFKNEARHPSFFDRLWNAFVSAYQIDATKIA